VTRHHPGQKVHEGTNPQAVGLRAADVLAHARICFLAVESRAGVHVTPQTFAMHGGRIWMFTPADSHRVRLIRSFPDVGLLVTAGAWSLMLGGRARIRSLFLSGETGRVAMLPWHAVGAVSSYARRNPDWLLGFSAELPYLAAAVQAPPVLIEVLPVRTLLLRAGDVMDASGQWRRQSSSRTTSDDGDERSAGLRFGGRLPLPASRLLIDSAEAAVGWETPTGPVAMPGWWDGTSWRPRMIAAALEGVGAPVQSRACITLDLATGTRPTLLQGVMLRGTGRVARMSKGRADLSFTAETVTWWRGLRSATTTLDRELPPTASAGLQ
jgi:Pyridoxamine 5'-phosphate oxidase